jgi:hypothetical protein
MRLASAALPTLYPPHPHPLPVPSCPRKQRGKGRAPFAPSQPTSLSPHPSLHTTARHSWTKSTIMRKLKRSAGGPSRGNGAVSLVPAAKPPITPRVQKARPFLFVGALRRVRTRHRNSVGQEARPSTVQYCIARRARGRSPNDFDRTLNQPCEKGNRPSDEGQRMIIKRQDKRGH